MIVIWTGVDSGWVCLLSDRGEWCGTALLMKADLMWHFYLEMVGQAKRHLEMWAKEHSHSSSGNGKHERTSTFPCFIADLNLIS